MLVTPRTSPLISYLQLCWLRLTLVSDVPLGVRSNRACVCAFNFLDLHTTHRPTKVGYRMYVFLVIKKRVNRLSRCPNSMPRLRGICQAPAKLAVCVRVHVPMRDLGRFLGCCQVGASLVHAHGISRAITRMPTGGRARG